MGNLLEKRESIAVELDTLDALGTMIETALDAQMPGSESPLVTGRNRDVLDEALYEWAQAIRECVRRYF